MKLLSEPLTVEVPVLVPPAVDVKSISGFDSFTNSAEPGNTLTPNVRPSLSTILNLTSPNIDGYSTPLES